MNEQQNRRLNLPNTLSVIRILLIPLFIFFYMSAGEGAKEYYVYSVLILIASALTDFADGLIARHYNQITDLGKILDPLADKLTQLAVVVSVAIKMRNIVLGIILFLFVVKEILMLIGGYIMLRKKVAIQGSKWYGKVATAVFYLVMAIVALFSNLSIEVDIILVTIAALFMLFAFSQYIADYVRIMKERKKDK